MLLMKGGNDSSTDAYTNHFEVLWYTSIVLSFLLGFMCLIFNSFTFTFYKKKKNETLSLMYTALSAVDWVAGISALLNGVTLVMGQFDVTKDYFVYVSVFVTSISSHVSVFYSMVLVVVRTINIVAPFYKTRDGVLKLTFMLYPILWVVITIPDIVFRASKSDDTENIKNIPRQVFLPITGIGIIMKMINNTTPSDSSEERLNETSLMIAVFAVCNFVPYILPAIISVICFIIQAKCLLRNGGFNNKTNMRITVTIFYLTLVFFVCNSASCICMASYLIFSTNDMKLIKKDTFKLWAHFLMVILQFLNSALSPLILIARGREMRAFACNSLVGKTVISVLSKSAEGEEIRNPNDVPGIYPPVELEVMT